MVLLVLNIFKNSQAGHVTLLDGTITIKLNLD